MRFEDKPIAFREDGSPIYDNAPSVAVLAVIRDDRLLVIQRATNPGYNLLALPGGYQMRGERWQNAAVREVKEETGIDVDPKSVKLLDVISDHYGNNVIFGYTRNSTSYITKSEEVLDAYFSGRETFIHNLGHWAFPTHAIIAKHVFERIIYNEN